MTSTVDLPVVDEAQRQEFDAALTLLRQHAGARNDGAVYVAVGWIGSIVRPDNTYEPADVRLARVRGVIDALNALRDEGGAS